MKGEGNEQRDHKSYVRRGNQTGSMVKPQSRFVVFCVQSSVGLSYWGYTVKRATSCDQWIGQ